MLVYWDDLRLGIHTVPVAEVWVGRSLELTRRQELHCQCICHSVHLCFTDDMQIEGEREQWSIDMQEEEEVS